MLLAYLSKLVLPYVVSNDSDLEEDFREKASKLISIEDIPALSKTNFSYTGQVKGMSSSSYATKIARSLKNLKERKLVGVDINNIHLYDQNINPILARWLGDSSEDCTDEFSMTPMIALKSWVRFHQLATD